MLHSTNGFRDRAGLRAESVRRLAAVVPLIYGA